MAISATDATDRVEQLIVLTERLTGLIAHEALAFEERRPQDAALHIEETSKLANVYRHESGPRARANPNTVAGAPLIPAHSADPRHRGVRRGAGPPGPRPGRRQDGHRGPGSGDRPGIRARSTRSRWLNAVSATDRRDPLGDDLRCGVDSVASRDFV